MLGMSQEKLADAIGLTFQQIQKYEKGANRMGSSRLQQIADILRVPAAFFFEDLPDNEKIAGDAPSPTYMFEFLTTSDGLALAKAFMRIKNAKLRHSIVNMVEMIVGART